MKLYQVLADGIAAGFVVDDDGRIRVAAPILRSRVVGKTVAAAIYTIRRTWPYAKIYEVPPNNS